MKPQRTNHEYVFSLPPAGQRVVINITYASGPANIDLFFVDKEAISMKLESFREFLKVANEIMDGVK